MTDTDVDKLKRKFQAAIDAAADAYSELERRASTRAPALAPKRKRGWNPAREAFTERGFPFDEWTVRRICARHSWAIKLPGGWHVNFEFEAFADAVERGEAEF